MDKRDIYEHLAKIYLDASNQKQKKAETLPKLLKNPFLIGIVILSGLGVLAFSFTQNKPYRSEVALFLSNDALKINFNFDPAKKETYSLDLNNLDLSKYKALGFSAKKSDFKDNVSLRVEFSNTFKEKSEVYITDLPHKWKDFKINFSDFKKIGNWQQMNYLCFAVEEWNTRENKGKVYIDNVRLIK